MLDRLVVHIGLHKTGTTWLQRHAFVPAFGVQQLVDSAQPWDDSMLQSLVLGVKFDPLAVRAELQRRWDGSSLPVLSAERLGGIPFQVPTTVGTLLTAWLRCFQGRGFSSEPVPKDWKKASTPK